MPTLETRSTFSPIEATPDGMHFSGLAIKYGDVAKVDKPGQQRSAYYETIVPGAAKYSKAIALYQHDPTKLLGTAENGTLVVTEDRAGIHTAIDFPDTSYGHDVAHLVARGDIRGQSFSFHVKPGGQKWETRSDGTSLRTLLDFDVVEFGPTGLPVYDGTTAAMRSLLGNDGDVAETRSAFSIPQHVAAANEALLQVQASIGANPEQAAGLLLAAHNSIGAAQRQWLDEGTAAALGVDSNGINTRLDTASKALENATVAATSGQDAGPHIAAAQATMQELQDALHISGGASATPTSTPPPASLSQVSARSQLDRMKHNGLAELYGLPKLGMVSA